MTERTIPTALSAAHGVFVDDGLAYFKKLGDNGIGWQPSQEEIVEEKTLRLSVRTRPDLLYDAPDQDYRTEFTPGEAIWVDGFVKDEEDGPVEGASITVTFLMYEGSTYAGEEGTEYPRRTDRSGYYRYLLSSLEPKEYAFVGRWELIVDASKEGYKDARVAQEIEMKKGILKIIELRTFEAFASYDPGGATTFHEGSSLRIDVDVQNQYGVPVRGAQVSFTVTIGQGREMEMGIETTSDWGSAAMIIDIGGEREYASQKMIEDEDFREGEWLISVAASMKGCEEDTASTTIDVCCGRVVEEEAKAPEEEAESFGYKHLVDYVIRAAVVLALAWGVYIESRDLAGVHRPHEDARKPKESVVVAGANRELTDTNAYETTMGRAVS